jgi:hypothetical protein
LTYFTLGREGSACHTSEVYKENEDKDNEDNHVELEMVRMTTKTVEEE